MPIFNHDKREIAISAITISVTITSVMTTSVTALYPQPITIYRISELKLAFRMTGSTSGMTGSTITRLNASSDDKMR